MFDAEAGEFGQGENGFVERTVFVGRDGELDGAHGGGGIDFDDGESGLAKGKLPIAIFSRGAEQDVTFRCIDFRFVQGTHLERSPIALGRSTVGSFEGARLENDRVRGRAVHREGKVGGRTSVGVGIEDLVRWTGFEGAAGLFEGKHTFVVKASRQLAQRHPITRVISV